MKVTILPFAAVKDILECSRKDLTLPEGTDVKTAADMLEKEYPLLSEIRSSLLFAVNETYVKPDRILSDEDVLAVFPPVSGG